MYLRIGLSNEYSTVCQHTSRTVPCLKMGLKHYFHNGLTEFGIKKWGTLRELNISCKMCIFTMLAFKAEVCGFELFTLVTVEINPIPHGLFDIR